AVAADPPDRIALAETFGETLADLDNDGIGRLVAEGIVDHRHIVDADGEIGAGHWVHRGTDGLLDRRAQPWLVEMAGQLIEMRQLLEPELGRLAHRDDAQHAKDAGDTAAGIAYRAAAILDPVRAPVLGADAVFEVERLAVGELAQAMLALRQILGVD